MRGGQSRAGTFVYFDELADFDSEPIAQLWARLSKSEPVRERITPVPPALFRALRNAGTITNSGALNHPKPQPVGFFAALRRLGDRWWRKDRARGRR